MNLDLHAAIEAVARADFERVIAEIEGWGATEVPYKTWDELPEASRERWYPSATFEVAAAAPLIAAQVAEQIAAAIERAVASAREPAAALALEHAARIAREAVR